MKYFTSLISQVSCADAVAVVVCAGEFVCDVDLMFSNCLQYNPRHTNEAKAGLRLQHYFHSELVRLGLSERSPAPPAAKRSRH